MPILRTLLDGGALKAGAKVLYDPKVNPLALAEWGQLGVEPVLFRNGHSQIKDYMNRIGAGSGAEESGHYYHDLRYEGLKISGENSIVTILLFLKAVKAVARSDGAAVEAAGPGVHHRRIQLPVRRRRHPRPGPRRRDRPVRGRRRDTQSATPDGIDLEGTVVHRGVEARRRQRRAWPTAGTPATSASPPTKRRSSAPTFPPATPPSAASSNAAPAPCWKTSSAGE